MLTSDCNFSPNKPIINVIRASKTKPVPDNEFNYHPFEKKFNSDMEAFEGVHVDAPYATNHKDNADPTFEKKLVEDQKKKYKSTYFNKNPLKDNMKSKKSLQMNSENERDKQF